MKYTLGNSSFDVNGNMYLKDVGGYTGTNKDSSKDVATVIDSKIDSMLSVNYLELKNLRDNGKLIPGQQYRITDYTTTTIQENTVSAGHQFDIIVTANSNNTLSEIARACLHEGDTYFSGNNANLSAWQIWYCLDNDTDRFEWADDTNGNGVIYRMIDEWGNDCPYDFKNIKFTKPIISETDTPDSKLYYTFCNYTVNGSIIKDASIYINNYNVYNNVIKPYYVNGKQSLNRILFIGNNCDFYSNTFGDNCFNNKFGNHCNRNKFGDNCYSNAFGDNCYSNTFGNVCESNKFDNNCSDNTFGNNCCVNTFGEWCDDNTFGNNCSGNIFGIGYNGDLHSNCGGNTFGNWSMDNIFGIGCCNNTFGNGCDTNTFGEHCDGNTFGDYCCGNTFGNDCYTNTFGNNCYSNIFGNDCNCNTFSNNCGGNMFGTDCYFNTFGNYCEHIIFGTLSMESGKPIAVLNSFYRNIIVDNGNGYIYLNCTKTTSSNSYYQNVRIGLGVNNRILEYKMINDSNVGQTYETLYRPTGSLTKTIE